MPSNAEASCSATPRLARRVTSRSCGSGIWDIADLYDFGDAGCDLQAGSAPLSQTAEKSLLTMRELTKAAYPQQFVLPGFPECPVTGRIGRIRRRWSTTQNPAV